MKINFLLLCGLLLHPHFLQAKTDCSNVPYDVSEWSFNSRKFLNNQLKQDVRNGLTSSDKFLDAYTGELHPINKLDSIGNVQRGVDGRIIKNVHVDHVIPRKMMHLHGGCYWSAEKKRDFSNDPKNLRLTTAKNNTSKGAHSPRGWLPKGSQAKVRYMNIWREIAKKYPSIPRYNTLYGAVLLNAMKANNPQLFTKATQLLKAGKNISVRVIAPAATVYLLWEVSVASYEMYNDLYSVPEDYQFELQYDSLQDYLDNRTH